MTKQRVLYIFALVLILLGLSIYGKISNPDITLGMCLEEPERFDGVVIVVGMEATVAEITPNGFILQQMGRRIPVIGNASGIAENDFVNVLVRFHKQGYLELEKIYIAKHRRFKIAASVLPVLIIAVLFFKTFYFDFARFQFYMRKKCRT